MEESSKAKTLKLGWIPYWNLWPFKCELNRLNHGPLEVRSGVPSRVNSWLETGQVQLAPCSSICLITKPELEMALPLGVASDGPVLSVYLGFYREHQELLEALKERRQSLRLLFQRARKTHPGSCRAQAKQLVHDSQQLASLPLAMVPGLKLSPDSASSAVLAKIMFNLWFGSEAYNLMVGRDVSQIVYTRRPLELLIGDEALQKRKQFHTVVDLGALWKEMTGLPFVYAVWQSKGACLNGWRRKILDVGKIAENRMSVEPSVYTPDRCPLDEQGKPIPLNDYWRSLYYGLGPRELKGLLAFLCLARSLKLVPLIDEAIGKILRWEDLSARDSLPSI
ncbi:MAG: hypothetical protein HRU09_17015 [Oligoflexales bacterium]|nr:hypothetical protein [Oligoflexales bacterium]